MGDDFRQWHTFDSDTLQVVYSRHDICLVSIQEHSSKLVLAGVITPEHSISFIDSLLNVFVRNVNLVRYVWRDTVFCPILYHPLPIQFKVKSIDHLQLLLSQEYFLKHSSCLLDPAVSHIYFILWQLI
jgi:hypothetical protein